MYWVYNKREVNKNGFYVLGIQQRGGKQSWILCIGYTTKERLTKLDNMYWVYNKREVNKVGHYGVRYSFSRRKRFHTLNVVCKFVVYFLFRLNNGFIHLS